MPLKANCSHRLKPSREVPQTQLKAAFNHCAAAKEVLRRAGGFVPVHIRSMLLAVMQFSQLSKELLHLGWEKLMNT